MSHVCHEFLIGVLAVIVYMIISSIASVARRKRALAVARKARNERVIGHVGPLGKCCADLVRIDALTEKEFTMFIHEEETKPLKEGDVFLRCLDCCHKRDLCPVLKRLKDPVVAHTVSAADGLLIVKSRTFDKYGAMYCRADRPGDDEEITLNGIMLTSAYDSGKACYVRTDLTHQKPAENA